MIQEQITFKCKWCSKEKTVRYDSNPKNKYKFCSLICYGKFNKHTKSLSGIKNPRWIEKQECSCIQCGSKFFL